tara:strand:+ start:3385 stop:4266 length:882 start_codon:yes stop_codon:yes gene_type:complete
MDQNSDIKNLDKNIFAEEWKKIESNKKHPSNYREIVEVEYKEFASKIISQDINFVKSIINSFYSGDVYILKNALSKKTVEHIIDEIHKFNQSSPSKFYKMHEGVPNFHRWIDKDLSNAYSIKYTKHSTHIFPWNEDISDVRETIMRVCRPLKLLSGLSPDAFQKNTPKDEIIERLQIARYPPTGFIEAHVDANTLMRLVISGYLSKRGVDYDEGGFYLIDEKDEKLNIEDKVDAGDVGLFYAALRHGMDTIDPKKEINIAKKDGRWWYGLNVHNSDVVAQQKRQTTSSYNYKN